MRRVLAALLGLLMLTTACATVVSERDFLLRFVALCEQVNARLAELDPLADAGQVAGEFEGLVAELSGANAPDVDPDARAQVFGLLAAAGQRFRAAEDAIEIGAEEIASQEVTAAEERLAEGSAAAQKLGMPALSDCEEGELPSPATVSAPSASPAPSPDPSDPPSPSPEPPTATDGWQPARTAPTARQQVAVAKVGSFIYVVGGLSGWSTARTVEAYDPVVNQWRSAPMLPVGLHHAMAVNYQGELVVLGGWRRKGNDVNASYSDRVFVLKSNGWQELARLRRPRAAGGAAVVDDKIVVVGGQGPDGLIAQTEVYDGASRSWRDGSPIPTPREHLGAAADDRFVYAVGGRDHVPEANSDALERYDPVEDTWTQLTPMPEARGSTGAAVIARRLVVVGGESPTGPVDTVDAYDTTSDTWSEFPSLLTPRHGAGIAATENRLFAIGGATGPEHTQSTNDVEALTPPPRQRRPTTWRTLDDAPSRRQQVAAATAEGRVWIAGGLGDDGDMGTGVVEGLDPVIDTWRQRTDLPTPVHHAMAVEYNGEFVVIGGWESDTSNTPSGKVYAWRANEWVELASLRHPRAAGAAAVAGGTIVVVGGQDGTDLVAETEIYDAETDTWTDGASIPTPREHLAAGAYKGHVYAVGGRALTPDENSAALERYDPATDSWTPLTPMPTPRGSIGAATVKGWLAVVGGETPDEVLGTVEIYDFAADTWERGPDMRTPRHGPGVAAHKSTLYVVGGAERTGHADSSTVVEALDFR